ncbi:MAG: DNA-processing protein DprA, partial [Sphingomonadales bacterium]
METSLRWQIALTMVPGLGPVHAKSLLNSFDIEEVFCANRSELENAGALPQRLLTSLLLFSDWKRVEEEICFIERNRIRPLFITDTDYPSRLLSCPDAPVLVYYKGDAQLNASRTIAVVGTRGCTRHGVRETEEIIAALAPYGATIISGLAMGIDAVAHQTAIEHGLPTLAVLPLGLDAVYPAINRPLARKILRTAGGLLTESMTKNYGDAYLFPRRNRIVAGCSDAIVVVESGKKG